VLRSITLVMFAALQWGLAGGLASVLMQNGWAPDVLSFWRVLIGLLCMLAWVLVIWMRRQFLALTWSVFAWGLLAGLGVAGNFIFYFISIREGSVAVAVTLMYSAPIVVYLASFALGHERPTLLKILFIALVMIGVVLLTGLHQAGLGVVTGVGVLTGLLSGISYAIFILGFKMASRNGIAPTVLLIAFTSATASLLPFIDWQSVLRVPFSNDAFGFLIFGILGAGLSFYCYFRGLFLTPATTASIVAMIEPVTAALFGFFVLEEVLQTSGFVGMTIILLAVTALSVLRER